jgi:alanine racemase
MDINLRGTRIHINISALQANLQQARDLAPAHSKFLVPLKSNAYGHGLEAAIKGFADADALGVAVLSEALQLRQLGWHKPIVILQGLLHADELTQALAADCEWVVHSAYQLAFHQALPAHAAIRVWLKINSGMNRLGFAPEQVADAYAHLQAQPAVQSIVLMTHFANADQPQDPSVIAQHQCFENIAATYNEPLSLANSGFLLNYPQFSAQWLRPGIMLYGAAPDPQIPLTLPLPAMQLTAKIIAVQHVQAGDTVGYGSAFRATQSMRIGVVSIGYGDGYPRSAPTGTPVAVLTSEGDHQLTHLVGRVSMDMITIDLTSIASADIGDTVELWGPHVSVDRVAQLSGTIAYELFCRLTARPVRDFI